MTQNDKRLYATYAVRKANGRETDFASVATSLENLKEHIDQRFNDDGTTKDRDENDVEINDDKHEDIEEGSFAEILDNITRQLNGYFYLSFYFTDILPTIGRFHYRKDIVDDAKNRFDLIEDYKGFPIYNINDIEADEKNRQVTKLRIINSSTKRMKHSIILSLVSTYDFLFSDLCRILMNQNSEKYEGSDKTYTISEILKMGLIDQIIEKVIDDEIDSLMSKSHDDQIKFFEDNFHIPKIKEHDAYPAFIELFQRRNLIAHGDMIVNERYINGCKKAGCVDLSEIGERLDIDASYIEQSISLCYEMLVLMTISVWRKRRKEESESIFSQLLGITFDLLKDGQPALALRLVDYALSIKDGGYGQFLKQAFVINRAIALKMQGKDITNDQVLNSTDFGSSSPLVRLCLASVKGDVDTATKCLEPAKMADNINVGVIRSWPAFQWIRTKNEFAAKVEEVFGQPVAATISINSDEEIKIA